MTVKLLNIATIVTVILLFISIGSARVQLFERGESGIIIPIMGVEASPDVVALNAGFEYTIESRSSLALYVSRPVKDSAFGGDPDYKSFSIYPTASFEILEPDREFPISAALNFKYLFHSGSKESSGGTTLKASRNTYYSGGPEFGGRFYIGDVGLIAPSLGYDFIYFRKSIQNTTTITINDVTRTLAGPADLSDGFLHDVNMKVVFGYMFNEIWGITSDPGVSLRFGGENTVEVFGGITIGLQIKFQ